MSVDSKQLKLQGSYYVTTTKSFKVGDVKDNKTLTASVSGGTVSFCTDSALRSCVSAENVANDTTYYVKVNATSGNVADLVNKSVSIKVTSSYSFGAVVVFLVV